jgi:hypothetical protein
VFDTNATSGIKVAVVPVYETAPKTGVLLSFNVKVKSVIVAGSIGMSNVAVIILLKGTFVALSIGSVEITFGATIIPVVNFQT